VENTGCYYSILSRYEDNGWLPAFLEKHRETINLAFCNLCRGKKVKKDEETLLVVIYFDDPVIDVQAEIMNMKTGILELSCLSNFVCYAREEFA
jgi:hypothetical protein